MFTTLRKRAGEERKQEKNQFALGSATFVFGRCTVNNSVQENNESGWDIIAFTKISLTQTHNNYYKIDANLVFCRPKDSKDYRWYEMSFFPSPFSSLSQQHQRLFSMDDSREIDSALSKGLRIFHLAYEEPKPIDAEDKSSFVSYWMDNIADAVGGELSCKSSLPFKR